MSSSPRASLANLLEEFRQLRREVDEYQNGVQARLAVFEQQLETVLTALPTVALEEGDTRGVDAPSSLPSQPTAISPDVQPVTQPAADESPEVLSHIESSAQPLVVPPVVTKRKGKKKASKSSLTLQPSSSLGGQSSGPATPILAPPLAMTAVSDISTPLAHSAEPSASTPPPSSKGKAKAGASFSDTLIAAASAASASTSSGTGQMSSAPIVPALAHVNLPLVPGWKKKKKAAKSKKRVASSDVRALNQAEKMELSVAMATLFASQDAEKKQEVVQTVLQSMPAPRDLQDDDGNIPVDMRDLPDAVVAELYQILVRPL